MEESLTLITPAIHGNVAKYGKQAPGSWGAVRLKDMAKELGFGQRYDFVYGLLSEMDHSGPGGIVHYVRQLPTGEISVILEPAREMVNAALQESFIYLFMALSAGDIVLNLGLDEHLHECLGRMKEELGPGTLWGQPSAS